MKKTATKLISVFMLLAIVLSAFTGCFGNRMKIGESVEQNAEIQNNEVMSNYGITEMSDASIDGDKFNITKLSSSDKDEAPKAEYNNGTVLVKSEDFKETMLGTLDYEKVSPVYPGSAWYTVQLNASVGAEDAVAYLKGLSDLDEVDYDYIMHSDGEIESIDISGNDYEPNPGYFKPMFVQDAWKSLAKEGKNPGGDPSVIVAVIDTGVDYNHVDLRNNIWINSAEIPNNGIDDDGNGYIDDVYGWDFVGNDNDPMDDNGHGTHCAGIVAAENNKIGTVGIAYNCKVMCLKAGTSSGSFNNSDIAEAVRYAYMNGASVISMSFGGTSISMAVEDALKDAYNQCVLVAAAGNDGMCNQPGCPHHIPFVEVFYPAALTYVIGVMSCNADGTAISSFSNFDHYLYNTYEYDVYAPGEQISSTFPNNKYAKLSGTSMATPHVAAIAALVRSKYQDRDTYSNKFITAQIVRCGNSYICVDAVDALDVLPTPAIYGIHDYYIFDNVEFDPEHNNGNGIIEAGETVHLGFELKNRGGKASDVTVSVNTQRLAEDITDPYIHILSNDITYSEIGTYSIRDGGKIYDDNDKVIDVQNPIIIKFDEDTPNDYLSVINFVVTYKNGLDNKDNTNYRYDSNVQNNSVKLTVTNGYILPEVITEDTVYTANRRYIVAHDVTIPAEVTVTFNEGCEIQFYYGTSCINSPEIIVYGKLNFNGTTQKRITIKPSELFDKYAVIIFPAKNGSVSCNYCNIWNMASYDLVHNTNSNGKIDLKNCYWVSNTDDIHWYIMRDGATFGSNGGSLDNGKMENCFFNMPIATTFCFENIQNSVLMLTGKGSISANLIENNIFCYEFGFVSGDIYIGNFIASQRDFVNNVLMRKYVANKTSGSIRLRDSDVISYGNIVDTQIADVISIMAYNNIAASGMPIIDYFDAANHDDSVIWPYVKNIELFNQDGEAIRTVGSEKATVKVTFNRAMDTGKEFVLYYGSVAPYSDYAIHGNFAEDGMSWTGEFQVKASIEGGRNFFSAGDACAADDSFKTLVNNAPAFTFDINTTSALSMNLQAEECDNGIALTWVQDDYDTLMGYNVYRSDSKDGNYVKLNTSVIPAGENTFTDENAEPGKKYWYTFTIVLSDMTESKPAGKISCTARDTINPTIYHTPVNQGYLENNLVISCTASDNIGIENAVLHYRTVGAAAWKTLTMLKQNDKYSATVFGSELSIDGLEYYISVSDGFNTITRGSEDSPYSVVIKDASSISKFGDVDGDNQITTKDALMLMQAINGDIILTDDQFIRADLNEDDVLSSVEALRILQYINGNVTTLKM